MTIASDIHCAVCGAPMKAAITHAFDTRFGIDNNYSVIRCGHCGTEQTSPVPTPEALKGLYETYYNFGGEKGTRYTRLRGLFLFSPLYRAFLFLDGDISFHSCKGSGRLLDIGCNEGRGLRHYRHNGFIAEGLELNQTAASVARSQGFTVHTRTLEEFQPVAAYDVAVLSNVLEHASDPIDMLRNVKRILKSGGQVWISCPNNQSWLRSVFGRYWINWHVPFHLVHLSVNSVRRVLHDAGFQHITIRHETPSLWAAHSVIARLFARKGRPTAQLRNPLLVIVLMLFWRGLLFPLLWLGNRVGRGDCLVVTARRGDG
jgi:2-polyprenyl-3-methyl-5-hydroxy-6-metoxy-1,4-benzoquinol methylase